MRRSLMILLAVLLLGGAGLCGCAPRTGDVPGLTGIPQETTETSVFFSTGRSLFEEKEVINAADPYRAALDVQLAAEPKTDKNVAIVQPQAKVRGVSVKDGVLTIDWSSEVLGFQADKNEKMLALAAVLRTFGEFPEVSKVRFTVDGKTTGTAGGKSIEAFWGDVSLKGQPWPVIRRQSSATQSTPAK